MTKIGIRSALFPAEDRPVENLRQRHLLWHIARCLAGCVLLIAAGLKGDEILVTSLLGEGWFHSRLLGIVLVEFEICLGCWLVTGWRAEWSRRVALVTFSIFAVATLYKAMSGQASCGCFGVYEVNPWFTLMLDGALVGMLFYARADTERPFFFRSGAALTATFILVALLCGSTSWWMLNAEAGAIDQDGQLIGDDSFVVLEPKEWVNQRLPLLPYLDVGKSLESGRWIAVLYKHDCSHCVEMLPQFEQEAMQFAAAGQNKQVALIEMPPYASAGYDPVPRDTACTRGRLDESREWFAQTPVVMELDNGVVTKLREHENQ